MDTSSFSERIVNFYNSYNIYIKKNILFPSEVKRKEVLFFLNKNGLNRKDIYDLFRYMNLHDKDITEENEYVIGDILDLLSGFCNMEDAINYIKFSDDPQEENDLLKYISSIAYD